MLWGTSSATSLNLDTNRLFTSQNSLEKPSLFPLKPWNSPENTDKNHGKVQSNPWQSSTIPTNGSVPSTMVGIKINWFSIQPHQTSWKTQTPTIPTNGLMGNQTPSNSQLTPLTTHHNPMTSPPKAHPIPKNGSMPSTMIGIKFNWLSIQPHEKPMQTPPNSRKWGDEEPNPK